MHTCTHIHVRTHARTWIAVLF